MKRILLYGGTFDPPHNGHIRNLKAAVQAVKPDRVVVMPAGVPPHKAASATPAALRLAMCGCFADAVPGAEISAWEIDRGGRSYTVDTLRMLRQKWPGAHLYLAVGSDMLLSFEEWREWREILSLATLVVQSRRDGDLPALRRMAQTLRAAGGHIVFAHAPAFSCASHEIRQGMFGPEQLAALVPPSVLRIMRENKLYRQKDPDGGKTGRA